VCTNDPSRSDFVGGPNTSACHQFDGNFVGCNTAFHVGAYGISSCFYDVSNEECYGCGPSNQQDGCINTCLLGPITCTADPARVFFVGGPNTGACHLFDGDQATATPTHTATRSPLEPPCQQ
jgi:hypothetical protein